MKKLNILTVALLSFLLSSCQAVAGIFKAGMGFGIFIVIGVIVLIIVLLTRKK